ncbi:MAG: T9SS type A sorting domain-containing protein [Chitinophagales bacterium]|nr:T9SS type A sorting domain-containing protein [Chitinophagaceae bacterium]MCB9063924.1 T9SS type A sorting domain-containing protein [Chitinophagales bacterium]
MHHVEVYDLAGNTLLDAKSNEVDMSDYPIGMYLVCVYDEANVCIATSKIFKK